MQLFRFAPVFLCLALWSGAARAHAIVLGSTPSPGQTLAAEELEIEIRFNSRIDVERSHLKLFGPDGSAVSLPADDASSADTLRARARALAPGAYRLHWQTLSPDGHITQGDIPFALSR
jgi:copper resistance protein C